ncbi:MAG: hypothetical protein HY020_06130, partial [Burkholderiales bacterium]|nr:hypothetical protein [Burkholderiales bacterium]
MRLRPHRPRPAVAPGPTKIALRAVVHVATGALTLMLAAPPVQAQAQRVSVSPISPAAGQDVAGGGVNNLGQVVGRLSDPVGGGSQAFVWSEANGLQALGTLGGDIGMARAINDRGQIVGSSSRAGSSALLGFIVQPGGTMQALPTFRSVAAINSAGQVLGMGNTGFAYLYANGLTRLALSSADDSLQVSGLSDTGGIAGAMRFTAGGRLEPFILDAGGNTTRLFAGQEPMALWTAPTISPDGRSAAGALAQFSGPANSQAFLWQDGVLSLLPAGERSQANAVNDAGMVAGWTQVVSGSGDLHAALWLNGRALDLHALAGLGPGSSSATAINAWGQVVVNHVGGVLQAASLVTLHPDWAGGDGDWAGSASWRYGGLDAIALAPGPMHDVVIHPGGSATVHGAALAEVRSLALGAPVGEVVTLDLNGGTTRTSQGTWLAAQSVLTGSGRLAGPLLVDTNT